jgi:hypothetical protein
MAYYWGDRFRKRLSEAQSLLPKSSLEVIAHCPDAEDNAYYSQRLGKGGEVIDFVCLGVSRSTPEANYAEDAQVIVHEIQHATTTHVYSSTYDLNAFEYDEAGSLNEALSDLMALMHSEASIPSLLDPKIFSRWALGSFLSRDYARGAHRCPRYDPGFPNCAHYSKGAAGFSADLGHVSYTYPEGLGWPFARNGNPPGYLRSIYLNFGSFQQIHNTSSLMTSVLWELYEKLRDMTGSAPQAETLMTRWTMLALLMAPKPDPATSLSPVTFRSFSESMDQVAIDAGLTSTMRDEVRVIFQNRGLRGGPLLGAGWVEVGPGISETPGLRFFDVAPGPGSSANRKFDRGDRGAIFFDLKNVDTKTAGGILLDVEILDPGIRFLSSSLNYGRISSSQAMIQYQKVYGSEMLLALSSGTSTLHVPAGNTYFTTDRNYDSIGSTALWIEVLPEAQYAGQTIRFRVRVTPSNGPTETLVFLGTIQP